MIEDLLRDRSQDRSHLFVFPSEVAADFWRRRYLSITGAGAVEQERFQSWDSFKEGHLGRTSELRPVNKATRRLFLADLLREPPPELRNLGPDGSVSPGYLVAVLPELPRLVEAEAFRSLPDAMGAGFGALYESYRRFLSSRGLFEPSWVFPESTRLSAPTSLFFPELLEDYREYREILAGLEGLEQIPISSLGSPHSQRREAHGHSAQELRTVMIRLDRLLIEGVEPTEIALTVANLDSLRPELRSLAAAYSIPIRERAGSPVYDLPGGRFFKLLDELHASAYHPDAMAALLLDRSLPWKERPLLRELVGRGREARCIAADRRAGRSRWLKALYRREELASLFKRLATLSQAAIEASSFAELQRRLYEFVGALFDDSLWATEAEAIFQRATLMAGRLVGLESSLDLKIPAPWTHFLAFLEEEIYVTQEPREGISVYPYRVSAGIRPRHHFVLNVTHGETRIAREPLSFLREDLRERFGEETRDMTDAFLQAYTLSGEEVRLSHSRVNQSGAQIPPAYFMALVGPLGEAEAGSLSGLRRDDPYRLEELYYRGELSVPEVGRLYPRQAAGSRWMVGQRSGRREIDYRRDAIGDRELLSALLGEGSEVRLSHTGVQSYLTSPFGYLLQRLLGVEELEFDSQEASPMVVGRFYHDILKRLNEVLRDAGVLASPAEGERIFSLLDAAAAEVGEAYLKRELGVPAPVMVHLASRAPRLIRRALEAEMGQAVPYRVTHVEQPFDESFEGEYRLTGRVDLLGVTEEGGYTVVDYKKGGLPPAKSITPEEDGSLGSLNTLQLPMYCLAMERQLGRAVSQSEELYYLSVERGELRYLRSESGRGGKGTLSSDRFQAFIEEARGLLSSVAGKIAAGDFGCGVGDPECEGCPFRGVCRTKFSVRNRND